MLAAVNYLLAAGSGAGEYVTFRVFELPSTGHNLALRRSNGSREVALWNDNNLWDRRLFRPRGLDEGREVSAVASTIVFHWKLSMFGMVIFARTVSATVSLDWAP